MRLQCAKPAAEAKQSSGLGDTELHQNPHGIDAIRAAIIALPPSHGLACASLQPSSAGYRFWANVLFARHCGNKPSSCLISIKKAAKKPWHLLRQHSQTPTGA